MMSDNTGVSQGFDLDDQRRDRCLTIAPTQDLLQCDEVIVEEWVEEEDNPDAMAMWHTAIELNPANKHHRCKEDSGHAEETRDEEDAISTTTREESVRTTSPVLSPEKVSASYSFNSELRCSTPSNTIKDTTEARSLQSKVKPWISPLPKPRISPPKTLGDAVIKNSHIRSRGGGGTNGAEVVQDDGTIED
jgi:hypothetical protein